jgi:hypothetical protein
MCFDSGRCSPTSRAVFRGRALVFLSYLYRFVSNFAFLALVYLTLNFLSKYHERAIISFLVLTYAGTRIISTVRQFVFFKKIERLEKEARSGGAGLTETTMRKHAAREVATLRHQGELKAYIDILFLSLIILLCVVKILAS